MLVPETDRERLYLTWYDLSVLYNDALARAAGVSDVQATKAMADEAWLAYVECISDLEPANRQPANRQPVDRRHRTSP